MFLQIIGFLALLVITGYFTLATIAMLYWEVLLGGNVSKKSVVMSIIFATISAILWWLVYTNVPFSLAIKPV